MEVTCLNSDLAPVGISRRSGQLVHGLILGVRPRQWIKNGFVFPALFFSRSLFVREKALATVLLFLVFCLLSGSVYLLNDVADRERDRQHPRKRRRPVAAGLITPGEAVVAALVLGLLALTGAFRLGPIVGVIAITYLLQNLLYSFWLKRVVLVDVFAVALGFLLRVLAGGAAIATPISPWLLITTLLLALFLSLAKRRHELTALRDPGSHRGILAEYSLALLDQYIMIATASTIVVYAMYTFLAYSDGSLAYTVPIVLFGMFRYLYLIYQHKGGGEPEALVVSDRPLLATMLFWGGITFYMLYR